MKTMIQRLIVLPFILATLACDSTGPDDLAAGTYELVSRDGEALPVRVYESPRSDLTSGLLYLYENATYERLIVYVTCYPDYCDVDGGATSGTYMRVGRTLYFSSSADNATSVAEIVGDEIHLMFGEHTWTFRRMR